MSGDMRGVYGGDPDSDWGLDDWDPHDCPRCDGEGEVMVCPDDMCRGSGECFGTRRKGCFAPCPACRPTSHTAEEQEP